MGALSYANIDEVIQHDGLRIVLLRGFPSPWGQAAKAMIEHKGLPFLAGALQAGEDNSQIVAWSGTNSAPVVAYQDEAPLNRWDDILLLLERLAPDRPLLPEDPAPRAAVLGLSYAICGVLGFGWNRRLDMVHAQVAAGRPMGPMGEKYGYNERDGAMARARSLAFMAYLADMLRAQRERGSDFIVGETVTAADFYWAAFSNLAIIQSPEDCPLDAQIRPMFESVDPEVKAGTDPILIEHRDRIMRDYCKLPMEL